LHLQQAWLVNKASGTSFIHKISLQPIHYLKIDSLFMLNE